MKQSIFSQYPQPIPQAVLDFITPVNKVEARHELDKVERIIKELETNGEYKEVKANVIQDFN